MGEENEKISHWELERLLRGDLPPDAAEKLRARIAASPKLTRYLASMRDEAPARTFADLQEMAARLESGTGAERSVRPVRKAESFDLWERVQEWLSRGTGPRWAYAAAMVLVIGISVRLFHQAPAGRSDGGYAEKGGDGFEVQLHIGESEIEPDVTRQVDGTDTVRVWYRSSQSRFVQLWFQEDDGAVVPFPGSVDPGTAWPGSTKWSAAPKKILLSGSWRRQSVFVIASEKTLSQAEVRAAIARGDSDPAAGAAIQIARFRLTRKP